MSSEREIDSGTKTTHNRSTSQMSDEQNNIEENLNVSEQRSYGERSLYHLRAAQYATSKTDPNWPEDLFKPFLDAADTTFKAS